MQDFLALTAGLLRESEFQVAHAYTAQLAVQEINLPGESDADSARQRARQDAYKLDQQPGQRVFESVAQGAEKEPCHGFSRICADKANVAKRNQPWIIRI